MNRLNEIEARANAATEGPWEWEGEAKAEWEPRYEAWREANLPVEKA